MLPLDDFEDDESNRSRGGELAEEKDEFRLEQWVCCRNLGRSWIGEIDGRTFEGGGNASARLIVNEGQELSFKMEKMRSRGL